MTRFLSAIMALTLLALTGCDSCTSTSSQADASVDGHVDVPVSATDSGALEDSACPDASHQSTDATVASDVAEPGC
jgi:hypothetical protein